jgi:hypothetical protein
MARKKIVPVKTTASFSKSRTKPRIIVRYSNGRKRYFEEKALRNDNPAHRRIVLEKVEKINLRIGLGIYNDLEWENQLQDMLKKLPGIGPITKYHLAKNIGMANVAKPDIWLERAAVLCSTTVQELVEFLSKKYGLSRHAVDVILWRYGADKGFR